MENDYKIIDGGVYDNPDVTIWEALNDIVADLKEDSSGNGARENISDRDRLIPVDYDGLMGKVEDVERIVPGKTADGFKAETKDIGAGGKAQKEGSKGMQDHPTRPSLRSRLTEQNVQIKGQECGKGVKMQQRER